MKLAAMVLVACGGGALFAVPVRATAPLYDASALNIGLNCQWQQNCIRKHEGAKKRALKYVAKYDPPAWRVQLCNRNARRGLLRVDWVGFNHCVRNSSLTPPPPPLPPRKKRRPQRERLKASRSPSG